MDQLLSLLPRFGFHASVFFKGDFCGTTQFRADERLGHMHLVRSGRVIMEHETLAPIEINEPTAVFYPRPFDHRLVVPAGSSADLLCANVTFNQTERNPIAIALPDVLQIPLARAGGLGSSLALLFDESANDGIGKRLVMDRLCDVLVIQLIRYAYQAGHFRAGILAGLSDPHLAATLAAVHARPAHPWRVEELAGLAHMSRTRFANYFRDVVGMTPGDYLVDWRMGLAQTYLRENRSVKEVAAAIGYRNQPAFTKAFVGRYGVAPTAWLREVQGNDAPFTFATGKNR